MICPECDRKLTRGETLCACGWRKGKAGSEWGSEYEKLPPCGRCSSTGQLVGPLELDRDAIRNAEQADKIPPYPFTRGYRLCSCPRGRMRQTLEAFKRTAILTPDQQASLERQYEVDLEWWSKERSRRGLVLRADPGADKRTLARVLKAVHAPVAVPNIAGHGKASPREASPRRLLEVVQAFS